MHFSKYNEYYRLTTRRDANAVPCAFPTVTVDSYVHTFDCYFKLYFS